MLVDAAGVALEDKKPSAETALHTEIYRLHPQINAVLHVHSVPVVALTRYLAWSSELELQGYEMLKAFPGITSHEVSTSIAIFDNSQDIPALARELAQEVGKQAQNPQPRIPACLIRAHGAYGWGQDMEEAERVIEALEHLLSCEIEALRLSGVRA